MNWTWDNIARLSRHWYIKIWWINWEELVQFLQQIKLKVVKIKNYCKTDKTCRRFLFWHSKLVEDCSEDGGHYIWRKLHKPPTFVILVAENTYIFCLLQETPTLYVICWKRSKSSIRMLNSKYDRQGPLSWWCGIHYQNLVIFWTFQKILKKSNIWNNII
jgi:hypothetical protein